MSAGSHCTRCSRADQLFSTEKDNNSYNNNAIARYLSQLIFLLPVIVIHLLILLTPSAYTNNSD